MPERELAASIATAERERETEAIPHETLRELRTELRHVHLPKLADVGLVEWDRDAETVAAAGDLRAALGPVADLLECDDPAWDDVIECLADEHRRHVVAVLESGVDPVSVRELARDVAACAVDGSPTGEDVDTAELRLHHVHLPKLADVGVVAYDADAGTVRCTADDEVVDVVSSMR